MSVIYINRHFFKKIKFFSSVPLIFLKILSNNPVHEFSNIQEARLNHNNHFILMGNEAMGRGLVAIPPLF
jgi:hypothetical protein